MSAISDPRAEAVLAECRNAGFQLAGIASIEPSRHTDHFERWIADGKHGSMAWLARDPERRTDLRHVLADVRSCVVVGDVYASRNDPADRTPPGSGKVARYARGRDYHKLIKKRLHAIADWMTATYADASCRCVVDTAPVFERELAERAGLGWIGKHTLAIHPKLGSYFFLGAILTTLELKPSDATVADHCGTCTRCIDACPTNAITPYSVDASRCISELTIERREPIPPEFHEPIGDWLYGCDICQEVCPHNSPASSEWIGEHPARHEGYTPTRNSFDLLDVLGWDEANRREAFTRSAMKRATLPMMRRNAAIVAGNLDDLSRRPDLVAELRKIADDPSEDEMVRQAASESLRRATS